MRRPTLLLVAILVVVMVSAAQADPRVLILGVDGCRPDALQIANTPNIDALIAAGAVSYTGQDVMTQGSSGPNWSSAMTGVNVPKHRVTSNSYNANGFVGNRFDQWPHMFSYLEAMDPSPYTASFAGWGPINAGTWADRYADQVGADGDGGNTAHVVDLLTTGDPDVIFIQLSRVDSAGHSGSGFSPTNPNYISAIERADTDVGTMVNALYNRPGYLDDTEDWLIITTTDHGGYGTSHHLPEVPEGRRQVWETFYVATGPTVTPGADLGCPRVFDIAATTLHYMGVDISGLGLDGQVVGVPGPPLPPVDFNDGLIVHLPFDGNADDASENGYHGTISGAPQFQDGKFRQALEFTDPASPHQYVSLGSPDALDFGADQDFSISFWVNSDDGSPDHAAMVSNKGQASGTDPGWTIAAGDDGGWEWNIADGSGDEDFELPLEQINDGNWHHLTLTHDRDGNAELYYDGDHAGAVNMWDIGDVDSGLSTVIAADGTFGSAWASWFDGSIDDLAIWGRVLSPREVGMIWNDGEGRSLLVLRGIPEPSSLMLLALGLLALAALSRRRGKRKA